jgi:hypothetical protein
MTYRDLIIPLSATLLLGGGLACDNGGDDDDTSGDDDVVEWPSSFAGDVAMQSTLGGEPLCDAEIDLQGVRYDGPCPECDFAFRIEATLLTDVGSPDCWLDPLLSYMPGDGLDDLVLAHASSFGVMEWYGMYYYSDALLTGYTSYGAGPYWWVLSHENSTEGTFARAGDDIAWTWEYQAWVDVDPFYEDCGDVAASDAETDFPGATSVTDDLDCEGNLADVYRFTGVDGETVHLTVDTVAEDTAFDPAFYVNGPDSCTVIEADDSFDCTWPPPAYRCPAVELETVDGDYLVVITSRGNCAGDSAAYELRFDGSDPDLVVVEDDVPVSAELVVDVAGAGLITE